MTHLCAAAESDEDDVAAMERQMWGNMKMPTWGTPNSSPFAPSTLNGIYPHAPSQKVHNPSCPSYCSESAFRPRLTY